MNYIFFDSKWRLHDGELPVKPDNLQRGLSGIELLAYALAMEDYDQAIADIKANALEIDNPEILQVKEFLGHRKLLIGDEYFPVYDGKFYQWPGSYEKKSNQASRGVFKEVAHLVLPPEEKNMKTYEELENENKELRNKINAQNIHDMARAKLNEMDQFLLKEVEVIPAVIVKYYYAKYQDLSGAQFLIDAAFYISKRNPAMNEGQSWFTLMADWARLVDFEKYLKNTLDYKNTMKPEEGSYMTKKIKACIEVLQRHIVPNGISDSQALSELYGLLDNAEIVKQLKLNEQPEEGNPGVDDLKNQITKLDEIGIALRAKLEQQLLDSFEDGYKCCKSEMETENSELRQSLSELIELLESERSFYISDDECGLLEDEYQIWKSAIERAKAKLNGQQDKD